MRRKRSLTPYPDSCQALAWLGLWIGACSFVGCSKSSAPPPSVSQAPGTGLDDSHEKAAQSKVDCPNASGCSPSVAMLVATTPSSVTQCTAFLLGPDLAVTDGHCVPSDIQASGSDCSDRIWLYFPDLPGFAGLKANCSQVLYSTASAQGTPPHQPDYAFLRLQAVTSRPSLKLSRLGFPEWKASS